MQQCVPALPARFVPETEWCQLFVIIIVDWWTASCVSLLPGDAWGPFQSLLNNAAGHWLPDGVVGNIDCRGRDEPGFHSDNSSTVFRVRAPNPEDNWPASGQGQSCSGHPAILVGRQEHFHRRPERLIAPPQPQPPVQDYNRLRNTKDQPW